MENENQDVDLENNDEEEETPAEVETPPEQDLKAELEKATAEALKWKGIAKRHEKKPVTPEKYVTKEELYRERQKEAEKLVIVRVPEIKENWDAILPYANFKGNETIEELQEVLIDAHTVWARRNPKSEGEDKATLSEIAKVTGTGGKPPSATPPERKRILVKQEGMEGWYK